MEGRHALVENERVHFLLERIVNSLSTDQALRPDLMQEALLHLWRLESQRPDQKLSWYLQSCRFRLQHYLSAGRSVDAVKRRSAQVPLRQDDAENTTVLEQIPMGDPSFGETCTHDLLSTLTSRLKDRECDVLHCLADGLPTVDIARRLQLSCPTVTKYRRKIARLVVKLGFSAGPPGTLPSTRETRQNLFPGSRRGISARQNPPLHSRRKDALKHLGPGIARATNLVLLFLPILV